MTWAEEEFGSADLGDKHLNKRLVLLADRLGEQPSASIPEACRGAAEMHAAYRFLGREAGRAKTPWPVARHARKMLVLDLCVQPTLAPNINADTARVLDHLGISLIKSADAGCCGAVTLHLNAKQEGLDYMRRNIDAW